MSPAGRANTLAATAALLVQGCLCLDPGGGSPNPPEMALEVEPLSILPGERVFADASGSTDADGAPGGFCFSFGDYPNSPTVRNTSGLASYTYDEPGTYDLRVVVFDDACPVPLLVFDSACDAENEDELVRRRVRCTRDSDLRVVTVLAPPESGMADGAADASDAGPILCFPDGLEPNDTLAMAVPSGTGVIPALTICDEDVDFFSFDLPFGSRISVTLTLAPEAGDLDAILIDPEGLFVAVASEDAMLETIDFDTLTPGVHSLEVFGFGGQRGGYELAATIF